MGAVVMGQAKQEVRGGWERRGGERRRRNLFLPVALPAHATTSMQRQHTASTCIFILMEKVHCPPPDQIRREES